ncbi:MAG: ABC transporter family substrate-binding protein [Propioniciclava sp.]
MSKRKLVAAAAVAVSGLMMLNGCTPDTSSNQSTGPTAASQTATIAWNQGFFSYNVDTTSGNATANANILYLTNDSFTYYDGDLNLVPNESFGTYEKISDEPLTITQTIAETATWSDGVPVTPADLVLQWGAVSGHFNTIKQDQVTYDPDTQEISSTNEGSDVYFDAADPSRALITETPTVDGNTITYSYSKPYIDWEHNLLFGASSWGLPAHIIGQRALGIEDPAEAATAVLTAFQNDDQESLSKISNVWNVDYNFKNTPAEPELLIGTGPYTISALAEEASVELGRNGNYTGSHEPSIDKIVVRIIADAQASVQALQNEEVLATQPQATADILTSMEALAGVTVLNDAGGTYEHVDMAMNNGGPFDPETYDGDANKARLVRAAFLSTIPRQRIVEDIIKPLNPEAVIRNTFTIVPGSPDYDAMVAANGMDATYGGEANLARAKELLAEAGVSTPVAVRFMYAEGNTRRAQQFQLIKESAETDGLFQLEDGARQDWGPKLTDTTVYDAVVFGWQSTTTAVGESDANFRTGAQNNFYGYSNAEVDAEFDKLQVEFDPAKQQEILQSAEKLLVDDAFGLILYQHPQPTAVSNRLGNFSSIAISPTLFWNYWEWTLDA